MSKMVNNYKGKHRGYLQSKAQKVRPERKGVPPVFLMWMNFAVKSRVFTNARRKLRDMLNVKGKKQLTGVKRQKVLDQYFAVRY